MKPKISILLTWDEDTWIAHWLEMDLEVDAAEPQEAISDLLSMVESWELPNFPVQKRRAPPSSFYQFDGADLFPGRFITPQRILEYFDTPEVRVEEKEVIHGNAS